MTAAGGRGPNLASGILSRGDSDQSIDRVIRMGVPGTTMPAFSELTPEDRSLIVSYLRSLSKGGSKAGTVPGDPHQGQIVYANNGCSGCHRVAGQGSILGPELSRIGAARSTDYIHESIVNPSADIPEAYQGVTVVKKDGNRVRGIRINEDTFSIQLRSPDQKIQMFDKSGLSDVIYEKKSLMPAYDKLSAADLENLGAYLSTLRGAVDSSATVKKAGGIK